jgi:very-short-patch-repair endonuclease
MGIAIYQRRQLRRDSTDAEAALWRILRGRRFKGAKFRRQHSCGPFIVDFYCASRRLVVELDGGQHFEPAGQARDAHRDAYLTAYRITVVRIPTNLIFRDQPAVLATIALALGHDPADLPDRE